MILILFSLHKYPEVELLNYKVFLTFCGNFKLFSVVTASFLGSITKRVDKGDGIPAKLFKS